MIRRPMHLSRVVFVSQSFLFSFPSCHLLYSPFFSLSLLLYRSRNSGPRSHSRLFSPLPITVRGLHFYCEKTPALSSLVDVRRIVPARTRRSQQLLLLLLVVVVSFCK